MTAFPFYGEQPTTSRRLHEEIRNEGNTYLLELDGSKVLTVADSGRDAQGEAIKLAERLRTKVVGLDVLFGGYRSFRELPKLRALNKRTALIPRRAQGVIRPRRPRALRRRSCPSSRAPIHACAR